MSIATTQTTQAIAPQLLVSVRDPLEANEALAGGARWIDLKDPRRGPLGDVALDVARQTADFVRRRTPLSAAAGELAEWPAAASRDLLSVPDLAFLKLGLASLRHTPWQARWRAAQAQIAAAGKQLIAVAYVDCATARAPDPQEVLELAIQSHAPWVLLDTFDKTGGTLINHLPADRLEEFLAAARRASCGTAVAGRLSAAAIAQLPLHLIDVIAVRGAACAGPRTAIVDRRRVAELMRQLAAVGGAPIVER